ncbi:MAG: GNAT family N-acetyltransferase [Pseudomonadota bacterium]
MSQPLKLAPLSHQDLPRVAHIRVAPEQEKFSGQVEEAFEAAETGVDFHVILEADHPVGFFKIDRLYHKRYAFARPTDVGLRAFLIDRTRQDEGIATRAVRILGDYVADHYPDRHRLLLTVNVSNPAAIACYRKGGFWDTDKMHMLGTAGPQHIFWMRLECSFDAE